MAPTPNEFGPFGQTPAGRRSSRSRKLGRYILLFTVGVFFPAAIIGWGDFYRNFAERNAPEIDLKEPPAGIGLEPHTVVFNVTDSESGLDEVIVRLTQADQQQELLKKRYPSRVIQDEIAIPFEGPNSRLKEGDAELTVVAFDRSFWSNSKKLSLSFRVDFKRPQVDLIASSQQLTAGGAGLAFYSIQDRPDTFSGVKVGGELYPGFPAKGIDPAFSNNANLYVVLFPIPAAFGGSPRGDLRVFARDMVGNIGGSSLSPRIYPSSQRDRIVQVSADAVDQKLDALFRQFLEARSRYSGKPVQEIIPSESDDERMARFKAVSREYRDMIEQGIRALFGHPKQQRYWEGAFLRVPGKEVCGFNEQVTYKVGGRTVGTALSTGIEYLGVPDSPIRSANAGVVIFADDLGPFGKTVIVDHGLGLTSMYSYLSAATKVEGDRVAKGEVVGRLGSSGMTFEPAVRFEMRLFGVPVRPTDWTDERWVEDNIESTIRNAKKALGIKIFRTLE